MVLLGRVFSGQQKWRREGRRKANGRTSEQGGRKVSIFSPSSFHLVIHLLHFASGCVSCLCSSRDQMHSIDEDMDATRSEVTNDTASEEAQREAWMQVQCSKDGPELSSMQVNVRLAVALCLSLTVCPVWRKFHHNSLCLSLKERRASSTTVLVERKREREKESPEEINGQRLSPLATEKGMRLQSEKVQSRAEQASACHVILHVCPQSVDGIYFASDSFTNKNDHTEPLCNGGDLMEVKLYTRPVIAKALFSSFSPSLHPAPKNSRVTWIGIPFG